MLKAMDYYMLVLEVLRNSGDERVLDNDELKFILDTHQRGMPVLQCVGDLVYAQDYVESELRRDQMHARIDAQLSRVA